jgi:predicted RNA binding protein YcfA (HicA-like mRNA interferase family)
MEQVLARSSAANVPFEDLCALLRHVGFEERVRGSHHVFRKAGVEGRINLQESGARAKPYQVRQVRALLVRHTLTGDD